MKKLLLITIAIFLLVNICLARPWAGFCDFELDRNGFPKGFKFGKFVFGGEENNVGNGYMNTNNVYINHKL